MARQNGNRLEHLGTDNEMHSEIQGMVLNIKLYANKLESLEAKNYRDKVLEQDLEEWEEILRAKIRKIKKKVEEVSKDGPPS